MEQTARVVHVWQHLTWKRRRSDSTKLPTERFSPACTGSASFLQNLDISSACAVVLHACREAA